jgi:hypothetical protein
MSRKRSIEDTLGNAVSSKPSAGGHIRDVITPVPYTPLEGKFVKIVSWNVNGLKAVVNGKLAVMKKLVASQEPGMSMCLYVFLYICLSVSLYVYLSAW